MNVARTSSVVTKVEKTETCVERAMFFTIGNAMRKKCVQNQLMMAIALKMILQDLDSIGLHMRTG